MAEPQYRPSPYDQDGRYNPWPGDFEPTGLLRSIRAARGGFRAPGYFGYGDVGDVITPSTPPPSNPPTNPPATAALRGVFAERATMGGEGTGTDPASIGVTTDSLSDFGRGLGALSSLAMGNIPGFVASMTPAIANNTPPLGFTDLVTGLFGGDESGPDMGAVDTPSETGAIGTGGPGAPTGTGTGAHGNSPSETGALGHGGPGAPGGPATDTATDSPSETGAVGTGGPGAPGGVGSTGGNAGTSSNSGTTGGTPGATDSTGNSPSAASEGGAGAAGGSSSCYITTAAVDHMGLDDQGPELQTLREFRDKYMASTPEGRAEIAEYERTAPDITRAINAMPNAEEIYTRLFDEFIEPAVAAANAGHFEAAHQIYRGMVEMLQTIVPAATRKAGPAQNDAPPAPQRTPVSNPAAGIAALRRISARGAEPPVKGPMPGRTQPAAKGGSVLSRISVPRRGSR